MTFVSLDSSLISVPCISHVRYLVQRPNRWVKAAGVFFVVLILNTTAYVKMYISFLLFLIKMSNPVMDLLFPAF